MRRLLEPLFITLLTLLALSCPMGGHLDTMPEKGSGVPSSYPRKVLLEMVTSAHPECIAADQVARRIACNGGGEADGCADGAIVVAFHTEDDLALSFSKASDLREFQTLYLTGVLACVSPMPAASVDHQPLEDASFGLFVGCSRWEAEAARLAACGESDRTTAYGIRLKTALEEATACVEAAVGFGEEPAGALCLTVYLIENGVERFLKGYGTYAYDWVVRGLMRGPDYAHHPFGYPLPITTVRAGDYVEVSFGVSLDDTEVDFEDPGALCVVAVLHEPWYYDAQSAFLPGSVVNVQQAPLGDTVDWQ